MNSSSMKGMFATALIFYSSLATAQNDYVVSFKNDTIRGKITILTYDVMDRVQVVAGKKKENLTALQTKEIFFKGDTYHTVKNDIGYRFMKLIKPGFLSLYKGRPRQSGSVYDNPYLVKKNGSAIEVPNISFKKVMGNWLTECHSLHEKIVAGEVGKKDLEAVIDEYNNCMDSQTKSNNISSSVALSDPKLVALTDFKTKLEKTELPSQRDAVDITNDIIAKVKNNQAVPNYLLSSLKELIAPSSELLADLEKITALLKNP